jgi:hypothetical protein
LSKEKAVEDENLQPPYLPLFSVLRIQQTVVKSSKFPLPFCGERDRVRGTPAIYNL